MSEKLRVAVIGGGWIGLYATKWMAQEGLDVVSFEKESDFGGNWVYRPERPGGVFRFTHSTSSKTYMHACDFPMPEEMPHFPHRTDVLQYIMDYAEKFGLRQYYRFDTTVVEARKRDDKWEVFTERGGEKGEVEVFDRLVVASGITTPRTPAAEEPWCNFTGKIIHGGEYKWPDPAVYEGKTVLVVGGGESATDIAHEVARITKATYLSIRSGMWVHDRELGGAVPADVLGNRCVWAPGYYKTTLLWCARFVLEYFWGRGGSGVKDWEPTDRPYMRSFINKSRDVMRSVIRGLVTPRRDIARIEGRQVWFEGHEEEGPVEVDEVILCTGFTPTVPFMKEEVCPSQCFHYVFDPRDTTMAYVGTARPVFGSFPALGEMQCRWAAAVWAGRVSLPDAKEMVAEIAEVNEHHAKAFPADHARRPTLVNHFEYSARIAHMIGAHPDLLGEYRKSPLRYWQLIYQTWTPFQYLINDAKEREEAFRNLVNEYPKHHDVYDVIYWGMLLHIAGFHALVLAVVVYLAWYLLSIVF